MELYKRDTSLPIPNQLMKNPNAELNMDQCYLKLIQLVHLLGSAFVAPHFWRGDKTIGNTFDQLVQILSDLAAIPGHDSGVLICENEASESNSRKNVARYTIQFGNCLLDTEKAAKVASRSKTSVTQVLRKLQIAFDIFAVNGIHDLYLRLPEGSDDRMEQIRICLEVLSHFDQAVQSDSDIVYQEKNEPITLPIIKDRKDKADRNLTLVAALNHLPERNIANINKKVADYIEQYLLSADPYGEYKIFNIMYQIEGLKEQLILPPIEVNNAAFRMVAEENIGEAAADINLAEDFDVAADQMKQPKSISTIDENGADSSVPEKISTRNPKAGEADNSEDNPQILELTNPVDTGKADQKSSLKKDTLDAESDFSEKNIKSSKAEVSSFQESKDADDPHPTGSDSFRHRLNEATDLLASLEHTEKGEEILNDIVETLQQNLENAHEDISTDLSDKSNSSDEIAKSFHSRIRSVLARFKEPDEKKAKNISQAQSGINFQNLDLEENAKRFDLSVPETKEILQILEGCFDSEGHFIRSEFELRIPKFITHEKKIFEFLWGYLEEPLQRNDRVAFLNALHLLASKMKKPHKALSFLLDELYQDPSTISYSDRNAFMLASLLLRRYNKENSVDIELTPGEVLLVKNGLDKEILQHALSRVEADRQLIKDKLDTIHNRLIQAFDVERPKSISWEPHFLLSLEREAFIFLSLTSGEAARQILISALSEYGNPKSTIYNRYHEDQSMSLLLQHLKLLIRGLGRVGDIEDLGVLADLKKNENDFIAMGATSQHENNVGQVFKMIDIAMGNITSLQ